MRKNKDTQFELVKGVVVTEAGCVSYNQGKRLDVSKYTQLDRSLNKVSLSDQAVRDKLGKNRSWAVCRSWSVPSEKCMKFSVLVRVHDTEVRTVTHDEICKEFGWKSFAWSEDGQMLLPKV